MLGALDVPEDVGEMHPSACIRIGKGHFGCHAEMGRFHIDQSNLRTSTEAL